jgi:16S rRNA (guanine527-N7)-methyltransferase
LWICRGIAVMKELLEGAKKLGIQLNDVQLRKFYKYYMEIIECTQKINLTRITDYEEVQIKHFLDSLSITSYTGPVLSDIRVLDIGTGAGFPGIPLKITFPNIKLTLLEATTKKTRFLGHLIEKLGLSEVKIVSGRAEDIAHENEYREKYDLVLSRAVAILPVLVELALPFCSILGVFIAQKKKNVDTEIRQSLKAITELGGRLREIRSVDLKGLTDGQKLVIIDKVKITPYKYPRRPGIPNKRPII